MTSRDELLRQLAQGASQPQNPDRRLVLPTVADIEESSSNEAAAFGKRRGALFGEFLGLRDRISHLSDAEFCRYQLLNMLFGDSAGTVGDCWQRVVAVRGGAILHIYETALAQLLSTGCIEVHNPE